MTQHVYLGQISNMYGNSLFLPYSVGCLWAYAQTVPEIRDAYTLKGFLVRREPIAQVVARLEQPAILGLSCYTWNWRYSLALAKAVKDAYPQCVIVIGGPQVPDSTEQAWQLVAEHNAVDILVHGEGEITFAEILLQGLKASPDYGTVDGIEFSEVVSRHGDRYLIRNRARNRLTDLSVLPSPYTTGVFDALMQEDYDWQPVVETNRGCPYSCLTLGTKVITMQGEKSIEDLKPYDFVLGWDHEKHDSIWNEVHMVLCNGLKPTYRLAIGDHELVATADHPIYTQRGWIRISDLQVEDLVLVSNLRDLSRSKSSQQNENLLAYVRCQETGTNSRTPSMRCLWETGPPAPNFIKFQKNMLLSMCARENPTEQNGRCQSYEASGGSSQSLGDPETDVFADQWGSFAGTSCCGENPPSEIDASRTSSDLGTHEKGQPVKASWCQRSDFGSGESILCRSCLESAMAQWSGPQAQSIRANGRGISRQTSPAIPVCGRLDILDWSGSVRETAESRFYSHRGPETRHTRPWVLLASGRDGSRGTAGLPSTRMDVSPNLGYPEAESRATEEHPKVHLRWEPIRAITPHDRSPVFDIDACPTHNFFANGILVSNCTFCEWGSATQTKTKIFPDERVLDEIEWFSRHQIRYVCCADANFGIMPRDVALVEAFAQAKAQTGWPKELHATYAKNATERVFTLAKTLNDAGMCKGVTMSFQSLDPHTLEAVKRSNIKIDRFEEQLRRYQAAGIPTYTEMILPLPEETLTSFKDGLCRLMDAGQHEAITIYQCRMLPNTEMHESAYRQKYGLLTVEVPSLAQHSVPVSDAIREIEELVVGTAAMPPRDWLQASLFAWAVQTFHCLGLTRLIAQYLHAAHGVSYRMFYETLLSYAAREYGSVLGREYAAMYLGCVKLTAGHPLGRLLPGYGAMVWPSDEASHLQLVTEKPSLLVELSDLAAEVMAAHGRSVNEQLMADLVRYQLFMVRDPFLPAVVHLECDYDWPAYFAHLASGQEAWLRRDPHLVELRADRACHGDRETFAREVVFWGRKQGATMYRATVNEEAVYGTPETHG